MRLALILAMLKARLARNLLPIQVDQYYSLYRFAPHLTLLTINRQGKLTARKLLSLLFPITWACLHCPLLLCTFVPIVIDSTYTGMRLALILYPSRGSLSVLMSYFPSGVLFSCQRSGVPHLNPGNLYSGVPMQVPRQRCLYGPDPSTCCPLATLSV